MRTLYLFLPLILLFTACPKTPKQGTFTSDELAWLAYQENQAVIFDIDSGQVSNTLVAKTKTAPKTKKATYPIEAEISLINNTDERQFSIYLLKDEHTFRKFLKIGDVYRSIDAAENVSQYKLDDKVYKDVYIFDRLQGDTSRISEVVYSKKYGIIKYVSRNTSFVLNSNEAISDAATTAKASSTTL